LALEREPSSSSQNSSEPRGLLYILLSAFAFFSGWLLSKSRTPNEAGSETVSPQDYTREGSGRRQIGLPIVAQSAPTPIRANQADRRTDDTPRWKKIAEWSIAAATVGLLIINIFLWWSTQKAANAAKSAAETAEKSFKLARQRAEDSDEAICNVRGEVESGSNVEHLTVSNAGKVPAHTVGVYIEVSRNSLPSNERITLFQSLDISQDELRGESPILKDVVLSGFGEPDWKKINQIREAVVVSGVIKYENGFGSVRHRTFCQAFLSQPANPGDSPQTPLHVLVDCDRLPTFLPPLYERLRKQAQH